MIFSDPLNVAEHNLLKAWFLNLGNINILGQIWEVVLCVVECLKAPLALAHPGVSSTHSPSYDIKIDIVIGLLEHEPPLFETTGLNNIANVLHI